jgi:hypothetical protein
MAPPLGYKVDWILISTSPECLLTAGDYARCPILRSAESDIDFVLDLPSELRDVFDAWATERGFDPTNPNSGLSESTPPVQSRRRFTR